MQYCCKYPQAQGTSVMSECFGVSPALSVLLSRFKLLPQVCYYDNTCNMLRSVAVRVLWVNDKFLIVSDRFHYESHNVPVFATLMAIYLAITTTLKALSLSSTFGIYSRYM